MNERQIQPQSIEAKVSQVNGRISALLGAYGKETCGGNDKKWMSAEAIIPDLRNGHYSITTLIGGKVKDEACLNYNVRDVSGSRSNIEYVFRENGSFVKSVNRADMRKKRFNKGKALISKTVSDGELKNINELLDQVEKRLKEASHKHIIKFNDREVRL